MFTQNNSILVMLRLKQVVERTGLSRSTIYNKLDPESPQHDAEFPKQVRLGSGAVRWVEAELNAWLEQCVNSSRLVNTKVLMRIDQKMRKQNALVIERVA